MMGELEGTKEPHSAQDRQILKLLTGISYNTRDPLNAIMELAALASKTDASDIAKAYLKQIDNAAHYIAALMNDVLDISLFESGRLALDNQEFDFGELLKETSEIFAIRCGQAEIQYVCRTSPRVKDFFVGDAVRIRQVMINMLDHALADTNRGGEIILDVRQTRSGANSADLTIAVIDNGDGIDEGELAHIMDPFYSSSVDIPVNPANLGLAIASDLVQLMGGNMTIDSRKGIGTRTTVEISLTVPGSTGEQPRRERDSSVLDIDFLDRRILLVEDNPINAEVTQELLETHGFRVEHASNGEVAVSMFEDSSPSWYDAILMDVRMPVMDGLEAVRKIRALPHADSGRIPIIAMSANAFIDDIEKSLEAGMNAHLSKPVDSETLFSCLAEYLL